MFLFLKLVLAHMVADFILQFEELYRLKLRSWVGHLLHALCHTAASVAFLLPYLNLRIWIFILSITIIHYLQDRVKYALQAKDPKNTFWYFTIDQIFHVLFLAAIFFLPESREPARGFNSHITLFLILFIGVSFKAAYFLHSLRRTFFSKNMRPDHFISSFEILWGLIERPIIAFCFLALSPATLMLSLAPAALRPLSPRMRSGLDFFLNYAYAALAGWAFSFWVKI